MQSGGVAQKKYSHRYLKTQYELRIGISYIPVENVAWTRLSFLVYLTVITLWIGTPRGFAQTPPFVPGNDIPSFVDCLNKEHPPGFGAADISDTVACVPDGCKVTVTMSSESAQPACFFNTANKTGQLPRVIFSCPGPAGARWQRFRPSYILCTSLPAPDANNPNPVFNFERVEIGSDQQPANINNKPVVNMQMADIAIPGAKFWNDLFPGGLQPNAVLNTADAKKCNTCHSAVPATNNSNSQAIDAFGIFTQVASTNLLPFVINTTEPNRIALVNPTVPGTIKQDLAAICGDPNSMGGHPALCTAILNYLGTRSCGMSTNPQLQLFCAGFSGGGLFLSANNVTSIISVDLSGQVDRVGGPNPTEYDFVDTESILSAYNYGTRTLISSVVLDSAHVTKQDTTYTATASGQALVNGQNVNITLDITLDLTGLTAQIRGPGGFLAGGMARPGTQLQFTGFN